MKTILVPLIAAAVMVSTTGCATKRHVQAAIAPIDGRLGSVEKKSKENGADIDQLQAKTSKTDEKMTDVERQAKAAAELASTANGAAGKAQGRADAAHGLASDGISKTDRLAGAVSGAVTELNGSMDKLYLNLDNYQKLTEQVVLFAPSASELSKDAKTQLDTLVNTLGNKTKFVIEVRGYTDQTGPAGVNLQLSRQRADAVVRYLTVTNNIPLRRIQQVGAGAEAPAADNKTRAGRQQNRRVEVKVFALPEGRA